ncbi:group II intron reverse transcriptase/maturase [Bacillus thuringiensis]|uniref:Group II intron reverse transcriptase/maturase n=1 Tax=Bacillus thuringiensis TaxID=1428 RepID=A0A9X7AY09_BACTU|nr:reverse transcriptase domain-containing protein [Bacillus thuringiensis]PFT87494.1 group II intron reverse transcriptase/maturase [Bacillus thuringiensis]
MNSKKKLRHKEYYGLQELFDGLYSKSLEGQKFYKLIHLITSEENIRLAYRNIKKNTGSKTRGTDGLTINYISKLSIEEVVGKIRSMFDYYFPSPVRRMWIEKDNGKMRPLGIPTMWDRLFQQCILQILEPICEAKFYKHSYGFRPNRSTKHAIARVMYLVSRAKFYHCVDIDIKGFFDNVDHGKLLKQMWTIGIKDKKLLSIMSAMLKAEIKGEGIPTKGTPQGGILSPLLSNIVLNELDWWIASQWELFPARSRRGKTKGLPYDNINKFRALRKASNLKEIFIVRYADDFKILCKTATQAKLISAAVKKFLWKRLKLECSEDKSKVVNLKKKSSEFLGLELKAVWKRKRSVDKYLTTKKGGKKKANPKRIKTTNRERKKNGNSAEYKELWSISSVMSVKSIHKAKRKIKDAIKMLQKRPTRQTVANYNSVIHGIQNYYKMATLITKNLSEINFHCRKSLNCRLKQKWIDGNRTHMDKHQTERFKGYAWVIKEIQGKVLSPIYAQKHVSPMNFSQDINNYTIEGRNSIYKNLERINSVTLHHVMRSYIPSRSIEYNDNRISKFISQNGKCAITKMELGKHDWECHHIMPFRKTADDSYQNLLILCSDIHKLVRIKDIIKIRRIVETYSLTEQQIDKINALRKYEAVPLINLNVLYEKPNSPVA